jgi:chromosome segregation ATPase
MHQPLHTAATTRLRVSTKSTTVHLFDATLLHARSSSARTCDHHDTCNFNDSVARLDQDIRQRDTELKGLAHRVIAHEDDAEETRFELTTLKREQTRTAEEHRRALADLTARAESAQAELDAAMRGQGEAADAVREREAELEKLRKQVRELQAESANREVHIALDSKQQELELVSSAPSSLVVHVVTDTHDAS